LNQKICYNHRKFIPPTETGAVVETVYMGIKKSQFKKTKESLNNALAALEGEKQDVVRGSSQLIDNLDKAGKKIRRQVLIFCAVGISLAISYFIVLNHKPATTDQLHKLLIEQQTIGAKPGTDASSESSKVKLPLRVLPVSTSEQEDLIKLLAQIREAQLKKDINKLLTSYSPDFLELDQKRKEILKSWEKYTYIDSKFNLTDLQEEDHLTISGKVIWNIQAKNENIGTMRNIEKSYSVTFSKKSGRWLIAKIEKLNSN
jgi:ketosteroid isomerase-like protein